MVKKHKCKIIIKSRVCLNWKTINLWLISLFLKYETNLLFLKLVKCNLYLVKNYKKFQKFKNLVFLTTYSLLNSFLTCHHLNVSFQIEFKLFLNKNK